MNIKMRTIFSFVIVVCVILTLNLSTSHAQDSSRWGLPEGAEARLGKGIIESIAYSPDGRRLAVGTTAGIWIYDAATGEERSLLGGHTGVVSSIAYSRDGKMLASAHNFKGAFKNQDYYVALWDVATGTLIKTLSHTREGDRSPFPIHSIAFSPDGTRIAVGDHVGELLWDVRTGTLIGALHGRISERSVTFSPDGRTIAIGASGSDSAPLTLWDGVTGAFKKEFHPTDRGIRNVAYSPDGTILACATTDGRVILWDVAASLPIDTFVVFEGNTSNVVAYSRDGKTIAVAAAKKVSIWDAVTGRRIHSLSGHIGFRIQSIAYSPDSRTVATGGDDGTVRFWNVSTGALRHTITGHTNEVNTVVYSPDGNTLAIGGAYSVNTAGLWDVATSTLRNSLEIDTTDLGWFSVDSLAYSPDGNTIAGGNTRNAYLWDTTTHKIRHRVESHASLGGIAYSSDGNTIASSFGRIALSPDRTKLVTQGPGEPGDTEAWFWDAATGAIINSFSPVETFGVDTIAVWDVSTRRIIDKLTLAPEDSKVTSLFYDIAYSPDGNTIAAAVQTSVYLWDATTGRLRYRLTEDTHDGHHYRVWGVTYSPDSTTLASGGGFSDRTVRLWDVKTGTLKNILRGHSDTIVSLAYSPDGTTLASGSHDGTVLLWNFAPTPTEPDRIPADVNSDGKVNIQDMVLVASNFGQTGENRADVNGDGKVNIADLVLVAGALGNAAAAPMVSDRAQELALTRAEVQRWLTQVQQLNLTDAISRRGILFLEQLLLVLTPKETVLLANYPNPFNPETWIPYQLAKPAEVTLHIYMVNGGLVRTLSLGHKAVGMYQNRSRAAYWDGKNTLGESVASGVYFYTLTAGDFTATRKMLIRK